MILAFRFLRAPVRLVLVLSGALGLAWFGAPAPAKQPSTIVLAPASPPPERVQSDTVALRRATLPGPYPVEILRVLDGDTFEARVRVWFGQEITTLVRIRGIDAPELKARCRDELRGAMASRDALARLLAAGAPFLRDVSHDKYGGRVVASIFVAGAGASEDVAATMIASGMARPYGGGRRDDWCPLPAARRG